MKKQIKNIITLILLLGIAGYAGYRAYRYWFQKPGNEGLIEVVNPDGSVSDKTPEEVAAAKEAERQKILKGVVASTNAVSRSTGTVNNVAVSTAAATATATAAAESNVTYSPRKSPLKAIEKPAMGSYYLPGRNHNPMMSVADYEEIRRAEQARIDAEREAKLAAERAVKDAQEAAAAAARAAKERKKEEVKIVKKTDPMVLLGRRLQIQGIMGTMAIVNGDTYSVGDVINKTGGAKLKSVGENYIIVEYKGKTLRKEMK